MRWVCVFAFGVLNLSFFNWVLICRMLVSWSEDSFFSKNLAVLFRRFVQELFRLGGKTTTPQSRQVPGYMEPSQRYHRELHDVLFDGILGCGVVVTTPLKLFHFGICSVSTLVCMWRTVCLSLKVYVYFYGHKLFFSFALSICANVRRWTTRCWFPLTRASVCHKDWDHSKVRLAGSRYVAFGCESRDRRFLIRHLSDLP
jgi:hypothetical protein